MSNVVAVIFCCSGRNIVYSTKMVTTVLVIYSTHDRHCVYVLTLTVDAFISVGGEINSEEISEYQNILSRKKSSSIKTLL